MKTIVTRFGCYSIHRWRCLTQMIIFCSLLFSFTAFAQDDNTYETPERLFHIARSANKNLVCYDVQLVDGRLNTEKPLHIYWVNREERMGETNDLNFFQRKMAYGYKLVSEGNDSCEITLTAYSGRKLTIQKLNGRYVCTMSILNQKAVLQFLYVKADAKNPLNVEYIELHGSALDNGASLVEKIFKE